MCISTLELQLISKSNVQMKKFIQTCEFLFQNRENLRPHIPTKISRYLRILCAFDSLNSTIRERQLFLFKLIECNKLVDRILLNLSYRIVYDSDQSLIPLRERIPENNWTEKLFEILRGGAMNRKIWRFTWQFVYK